MTDDDLIKLIYTLRKDLEYYMGRLARSRDTGGEALFFSCVANVREVDAAYRAAIQHAKDRLISDNKIFPGRSGPRYA